MAKLRKSESSDLIYPIFDMYNYMYNCMEKGKCLYLQGFSSRFYTKVCETGQRSGWRGLGKRGV